MVGNDLLKACGRDFSVPAQDLTEGLVAHYLLNNNADDSHGSTNAIPTAIDFQGDVGYFNGTTAELNGAVTPHTNGTVRTYSLWFTSFVPQNSTAKAVFHNTISGSLGFYFDNANPTFKGGVFVRESGGTFYMTGGNTIAQDTLIHAVVVFNNTTVTLYLNGVESGTTTFDGTYWSQTDPIMFGDFEVSISNLRVYNEAKNQAFINALYAEGYYPKPLPLPTTTGLVAHYPLTGTAEDAHGEGGNESGTEFNGVAFVDEGAYAGQKTAIFDGIDDYIGNGVLSPNTTDFAVSVWVKPTGVTGMIFDTGWYYEGEGNDVDIVSFVHADGRVYFGIRNGATLTAQYFESVTINSFSHIVYTKTTSEMNVYINGVAGTALASTINLACGKALDIGAGLDASGTRGITYKLDGQLAEFRVYSNSLNQADILNLANKTNEPTVGLIAHYKLDGDVTDETGTYNGTAFGGLTYSDEQRGDSVASFAGDNDYIGTTYTPTDIDCTYSVWVKGASVLTSVPAPFVFSGGGERHEIHFGGGSTTTIRFFGLDNYYSISYADAGITSTAVWYHIVMTIIDGIPYAYINGIQKALALVDTTPTTSFAPMTIGCRHTTTEHYWDGEISDLRIYDRVLTATEITALFNEVNEPELGLVAHYPLTLDWRAEDAWVGYDGTEVSMVYKDDAEFGSVPNFDGAADYATTPVVLDTAGPQQITAWVQFDTAGATNDTIVGGLGASTDRLYFGTQGTLYRLGVGDSFKASVTHSYISGVWYFVSLSWDGTNARYYVNNVLVDTMAYTPTGVTTVDIGIGVLNNNGTFADHHDGSVRNVRFYTAILTTNELDDIYNYEKNFRPIDIDDGLVAYYPLANNSLDNYKNEYDGTDTGAITYDGTKAIFPTGLTYIETGITDTLFDSDYSISFFAEVPDTTTYRVIINTYRQLDTTLEFVAFQFRGDGFLHIAHRDTVGTNYIDFSTFAYSANTLYHIVLVKTDTALKVYVDGVLEITISSTSGQYSGQGTIGIGRDKDYGAYFEGYLGKFRPFNKAITAEQVEVIYNTEKGDFV